MEEEKLMKCESCNKEVPEFNLNRDGECSWCRANDKATDMTVGTINKLKNLKEKTGKPISQLIEERFV